MLTTVPALRMRRRDAARLAALIRRCEHTLVNSAPPGVDYGPRLERLRQAANRAAQRPTRRALAIFADADWDHTDLLPQPVFDRVVVDSHFDARDLLFAEQFHPDYRMLLVDADGVRIHDSYEDTLLERAVLAEGPTTPGARGSVISAAIDRVAAMNDTDPRPLVLAAAPELSSRVSARIDSFAGNIGPGWTGASEARLSRAARLRVAEWCARRARREIPESVGPEWMRGSTTVQRAVAANPRGVLLVEANRNDGFPRGIHVVDPAEFGFRPTSINAAIARVRSAGGDVHFVADGDLRPWGCVLYRPS